MNCECAEPGFCPRYKREIHGRLREICRGENIDPGTAAQYRALWEAQASGQSPLQLAVNCPFAGAEQRTEEGSAITRECTPCGGKKLKVFQCNHPAREPEHVTVADCNVCPWKPRIPLPTVRKLVLKNLLCPGDALVMSAAVYSLHKAHPGKFLTAVDTTAMQIWEHNPDVVPNDGFEELVCHYPAVHQCNQRGITFMSAYCEFLEDALGVRVPLATNRPMLYLSNREKSWLPQVQEITQRPTRYWLVNAGRKGDYTSKHWSSENFQRVVDLLRGKVLFVQIGEAGHHHPPLRNVLNLVGKTDTRQLIRLMHHADGALCGVTFLQHLAAALEKPCICIMGGREPVTWNSYPREQLMHTVGMLPCCRDGGCWKSRTVALNDGDEKDKSLCENPVIGDEPLPRCMALIRPETVAETILTIDQSL